MKKGGTKMETAKKKNRIVITLDGGLIQDIFADVDGIEVLVVDYDTTDVSEDGFMELVDMGNKEYAYVYECQARKTDIDEIWEKALVSPKHPSPQDW